MKQSEAIAKMHSGANVFLTGEPGAGKTYTLNKFIEEAQERGKRIAITASTGIAASHLGGTTIHSWSGLGIADSVKDSDLDRMSWKPKLQERYNRCDILIIDEVSMLHGSRLDMVDRACRWIRHNEKPFGGLQVILVGDMFQLPPVVRGSSETDFAHHSNAWRVAELTPCYLTEQHRQGADDNLLGILRSMRQGGISPEERRTLESRTGLNPDETITKLYTHNVDVDSLNNQKLSQLDGPAHEFYMSGKGSEWEVDKLKKNLLCPEKLELKIDAEVMFVANDFEAGFVNGTRGRVIGFQEGEPVVETTDGLKIQVERYGWRKMNETGEYVVAEVWQTPLRLAWAVTIHKSQGMSLDAAEIDLTKAFVPGMGYVALSRVRSLDGLYLVGLGPQALQMDRDIYEFDKALKQGRS
jgi:ATP-dependent DNA helicase PIF1